jgi:hypothetical protein
MDIISRVEAILEDEGLDCVVLEEKVAVKTGLTGESGDWICNIERIEMGDEIDAVAALSRYVEPIPGARRPDAALLANAINSRMLAVGSFDVDMSDGEVVYRTSLAFSVDADVNDSALRLMLLVNWTEIDRYLPLFDAIAAGEDAQDVIAELDGEG